MTRIEFDANCWPYYLYLENKFLEATQYVHLSPDNYKCYSYEYNSLLITTSTEFENILKIIYKSYGNPLTTTDRHSNRELFSQIKDKLFIHVTHNTLPEVSIINSSQMVFKPFDSFFSADTSQTWWECYTNVKHWRIEKFTEANMENVLMALAAVFILDSLFMINNPHKIRALTSTEEREIDAPSKPSRLFLPRNFHFRAHYNDIVVTP